jgi:hypothetical protein
MHSTVLAANGQRNRDIEPEDEDDNDALPPVTHTKASKTLYSQPSIRAHDWSGQFCVILERCDTREGRLWSLARNVNMSAMRSIVNTL